MSKVDVRPKIWYDYMKWLINRVGFNKKKYYKLIKMLHDTEFVWPNYVEMDRNRAGDGTYQRYYFFRELGLSYDSDFPFPCSVLEMLVGFAIRMGGEYLGYSSDGSDGFDIIFMMFLKNLGLNLMDDDHFDEENVKYILQNWMDRNYKNDGKGSIFILKKSKKGFNEMEIWKQMNIFLTENDVENVDDILAFL